MAKLKKTINDKNGLKVEGKQANDVDNRFWTQPWKKRRTLLSLRFFEGNECVTRFSNDPYYSISQQLSDKMCIDSTFKIELEQYY